ncbi:DUF1289 domain-containing protein [uncultured Maricaulis sp.]|uniref:DUF1289 domain-containing protein n=1 Tax=uncultured Maricaulis sp. TaxID=174710 RepID=UPI0030D7907F
MSPAPIKTPCVKVCFVDPADGICVGCFRTMDELGLWTKYSDAEREAILAALPRREAAYADRHSRAKGSKS